MITCKRFTNSWSTSYKPQSTATQLIFKSATRMVKSCGRSALCGNFGKHNKTWSLKWLPCSQNGNCFVCGKYWLAPIVGFIKSRLLYAGNSMLERLNKFSKRCSSHRTSWTTSDLFAEHEQVAFQSMCFQTFVNISG